MKFEKYQHVERFGNTEVSGIEDGLTYIFPKIDGTNSSVWMDDGIVKAGSRNRELSLEHDNAGFYKWVSENKNIFDYLTKHQNRRIFGEWLVPHSLKTYQDSAWRNFYVFDIIDYTNGDPEYIPYDEYKEELDDFGISYIPIICKIKNGNADKFTSQLEKNVFLIKDGEGAGEGIVIKNYSYKNKYGRIKWAKIVTSEFKTAHMKSFDAPTLQTGYIEEKIIDDLLTSEFIEKEYSKIAIDGWESKYIPKLLGIVWHEFIVDESWNIVKKYNNPKIDFKVLQRFLTLKVKEVKADLF